MNHTKNYHLPQWVEDDLILMEDFNQMNRDIEAGIDGAKAEAKADAEELGRQVAAANIKAEAAMQKPYAAGHYTGNGGTISVNIGFKPSFLIITAQEPTLQGNIINAVAILGDQHFSYMVERTSTGFNVIKRTLNPGTMPTYPRLNEEGVAYNYIAFR